MKLTLLALLTAALGWSQTPAQAPAPPPPPHAPVKEFANIERYHAENAQLAPPAPGENRVVFMGDSITDGWGRKYGTFFTGKPYVNRGISGQTTPQMLIRFRPDVIALKPKVVVILAGTNDIAGNTGPAGNEDIQGNLESMSELARAHDIRVVLASVTPVSAYHVAAPPGAPPEAGRPQ